MPGLFRQPPLGQAQRRRLVEPPPPPQTVSPSLLTLTVSIPTLALQQAQIVDLNPDGWLFIEINPQPPLVNQSAAIAVLTLTAAQPPPSIDQSVAPALVSLTTTLSAPEAVGPQTVEPYGVSVTFDPIEIQSFASGEDYPHSTIEVGGALFVGTLTNPGKLLKFPDPTDLSTYSVLTFSTNEQYVNSMCEVGGYIYTAHASFFSSSGGFGYHIRISKINAAAHSYVNFIDLFTGSTADQGGQISIATDGSYLYVLTGYPLNDSRLFKVDISDGSVDASLALTGLKFGHTLQYYAGNLYFSGSDYAVGAWAATCTTNLTGLVSVAAGTGFNKLVTDDSAIVNGEYWLGMEGSGEATGTVRRVALDMSGYTDSLTGVANQIYGILPESGVVAVPHATTPGSLVFLSPQGSVLKRHNFEPGQNSVNEFIVIGDEAYYTFYLPPGKVGRADWAVDGTSSLVVPLTIWQPSIKQELAPSVVSLTTTLHSPTISIGSSDQTVSPEFFSQEWGHTDLLLNFTFGGGIGPTVHQSVSPALITLAPTIHSPTATQTVDAGLITLAASLASPGINQTIPTLDRIYGIGKLDLFLRPFSLNQSVAPSVLSLPATLHAPSVDQQVRDFVEAAIGWPMVVTLRSPTIQIVQTVEAGLVTLAPTLHSPIVTAADAPQTVEPGVLTLPATLHSPTITAPASPALVSLATTVHAPTITAPVSPALVSLTATLSSPSVNQLVSPALVSLTTTVHAPTVPQSVAPALLSLATTLHSPTAAIEAQTVSPARVSLGTNIRSTRGIGNVLPGVGTGVEGGQTDEALPLHLSLGFRAWGYAGSDSSGTPADALIADNVWVSLFTATSTGIVTALSAQLWAVIPSSFLARAVIYLDSGGAPSVLWGDGPDTVVSNHTYQSRVELPLGTHVDSGFAYWIGVHFRRDDTAIGTGRFQIELTANQTLYSVADFDDGTPTSWVAGGSFVGPLHVHALMGPAISQAPGAAPGLISLATTLHAPEITGGTQTVSAGLISLATTVHAPTVVADQTVSPGVVSLTLALLSPMVAVDQTVSSGVVSLGLTLSAPTVELAAAQTVSPGVVSLAATIRSPGAGLQGLVSLDAALSLSLAAHAPTVSTLAAPTASPNLLALTLTAHAPTLQSTQTVSPSRVSLAVTPATHAVILSASAWRRLRAVQYHAVVYSPDANGGPGNPKLELDPHILNLVWSQTQNLAGQAAFALARRNPVLDQITWMVDHVKIFRETAAGTQTVFAGKLVQPVLSGTDCFVYCLDYMGFLQLSITGYRTAYATKKIGSEVIAPEWALAKALTNSPFAFVTTGTIQNPLALDGTTEITTNADFGVVLFDRLFTFNTLAEMSMANTANNVKFEITRVAGHTFNLWRNYGTNQTAWAGVMPGTVASYDFDGGKDGQRFDLRTVLSDGAGGQVEYSVQTSDADTTLLRRLQASVAIRTLFGASGGTTETDQGKAALARQLVVSTRYPRLVRVSPRHGDFPLFSGNDLGDRFRVIVQKPDKTGDFYDGYLLWQQVIGAWEPSGGGELLDLYLRGQT